MRAEKAVVIGAGVAGLAAAGCLRRAGVQVSLIEAEPRIGGRAFTDCPAALHGRAFDHGAQWLHAAEHNPLVPLAQARGEWVGAEKGGETRVGRAGGAFAAEGEYEAAAERWRAAVSARLGGADMSVAEAAGALASDPWAATVEAWETTIIAAAEAPALSLADWSANSLEGSNFVPGRGGGLGAMLARVLGPQAGEVRKGVRATAVAAIPEGVRVETTHGSMEADAAVVAVSTGVLRAEAIGFTPGLPEAVRSAIGGLPMGHAMKIALPATGEGRLGLGAGADLFRQIAHRGDRFVSTLFWPGGAPFCVGFLGGDAAFALAGRGEAEAFALLREELAALLGARSNAALGAAGVRTQWSLNPHFGGAYAYAVPGAAGARAVLREPLWEGRLVFAGEATAADGLAGTVGGAYASGVRAAAALLAGR